MASEGGGDKPFTITWHCGENKKKVYSISLRYISKEMPLFIECRPADYYKMKFIFQNMFMRKELEKGLKEMNYSCKSSNEKQEITVPRFVEKTLLDGLEGLFKSITPLINVYSLEIIKPYTGKGIASHYDDQRSGLDGKISLYQDEDSDSLLWLVSKKEDERKCFELMKQLFEKQWVKEEGILDLCATVVQKRSAPRIVLLRMKDEKKMIHRLQLTEISTEGQLYPLDIECGPTDYYKLKFIFSNKTTVKQLKSEMEKLHGKFDAPESTYSCIIYAKLDNSFSIVKKVEEMLVSLLGDHVAVPCSIYPSLDKKQVLHHCSDKAFPKKFYQINILEDENDHLIWLVAKKTAYESILEVQMYLTDNNFVGTPSERDGGLIQNIQGSLQSKSMERIQLNPLELELCIKFDVCENTRKLRQDFEIFLDKEKSEILIESTTSQISLIKSSVQGQIKEIVDSEYRCKEFPKSCVPFLLECKEKIEEQLQANEKIRCHIHIESEMESGSVCVYAKWKDSAKKGAFHIQNMYEEKDFEVPEELIESGILKEKIFDWKKVSKNMIDLKFTSTCVLQVYGSSTCVAEVVPKLQDYLQQQKSKYETNSKPGRVVENNEKYTPPRGRENPSNAYEGSFSNSDTESCSDVYGGGEMWISDEEEIGVLMKESPNLKCKDIEEKFGCEIDLKMMQTPPDRKKMGSGYQWNIQNDGKVIFIHGSENRGLFKPDVLVECKQYEGADSQLPVITFQKTFESKHIAVMYFPKWIDGFQKEKEKATKQISSLFRQMRYRKLKSVTIPVHVAPSLGWQESKFLKQFLSVKDLFPPNVTFCHPDTQCYNKLLNAFDILGADMKGNTPTSTEIKVTKGLLVESKAQVLVNTTSKNLDLQCGKVSQSILKGTGPDIKKELKETHPDDVNYGEVVCTEAYRLRSSGVEMICHGHLPIWMDNGIYYKNIGTLKSFVAHCMFHASQEKMKSVAFPSIGTGNLGYPPNIVANAMFETAYNFVKSSPDSTIAEILFCIFPGDKESVKAFEETQKKFHKIPLQAGCLPPFTYTYPKSELTFHVVFGEMWIHRFDAVVIMWDQSELFTSSYDSKKYLHESGQDVVNSWNYHSGEPKQQLQSKKIKTFYTRVKNLPFKCFIHVRYDEGDLSNVIECGLKQVEILKLTSAAFVVSDKDIPARHIQKIVLTLHETVKIYLSRHDTKLKKIWLVVSEKLKANVTGIPDTARNRKKRLRIAFKSKVKDAFENVQKAKAELQGKLQELTKKSGDKKSEEKKAVQKQTSLKDYLTEEELERKNENIKKSKEVQHDHNMVSLERTEDEKCSLLITIKNEDLMEKENCVIKSTIKEKVQSKEIMVIHPFQSKGTALLKFKTHQTLKQFKETFTDAEFVLMDVPAQAVNDLKATISQSVKDSLISNGWNLSDIEENSGVQAKHMKESFILEGSLLEMQVARNFIQSAVNEKKSTSVEKKSGEKAESMLETGDLQQHEEFNKSFYGEKGDFKSEQQDVFHNVLTKQAENTTKSHQENSKRMNFSQISGNSVDISNIPEIVCSTKTVTPGANMQEPAEQIMRNKEKVVMTRQEYKIFKMSQVQEDSMVYRYEKEDKVEFSGHFETLQPYRDELDRIRKLKKDSIHIGRKEMAEHLKNNFTKIREIFHQVIFLQEGDVLFMYSTEEIECKDAVLELIRPESAKRGKWNEKPKTHSFSKSQKGSSSSNKLYTNLHVVAHGNSRSVFFDKETTFVTKEFGVNVYVYTNNILQNQITDCFVNPTNEKLDLGSVGGFSAAVDEKAGPDVQKQCSDYMKNRGKPLDDDGCFVSGAGKLSYSHIIHVVTKPWKYYADDKDQTSEVITNIGCLVRKSLEQAEKNKVRSISIPGIGTGKSGIPRILCVRAYVKGLEDFGAKHPSPTYLKDVHFVLSTPDLCDFLRKNLLIFMPWYSLWPLHDQCTFNLTKSLSVVVAKRNVVEEENVDGIVVCDNKTFNGQGDLVQALIKKSTDYSHKRKELASDGATDGCVVPLKCAVRPLSFKVVYHIIMPFWRHHKWGQEDIANYKKSICKLLKKCEEKRYQSKSIAMKLFTGGAEDENIIRYLGKAVLEAITEFAMIPREKPILERIYILNSKGNRHTMMKELLENYVNSAAERESIPLKMIKVRAEMHLETGV